MLQGLSQGDAQAKQMGLAGEIPSTQNVGGAAATDIDPATGAFNQAHRGLTELASVLHQLHDDEDANKLVQLAVDLKNMQLARRKNKAADQANASSRMSTLAPVAGLNATGVPQQGV